MKPNLVSILGLLLVLLGIAFFLGIGIPGQETLLEVGEFSASVETERSVPPWVAALVTLLGVAAVAFGQKKG